jgi:hypothetical protein
MGRVSLIVSASEQKTQESDESSVSLSHIFLF